MFGLSLIHLIVPVVIVLWALNSRRYERNTRLLVERERAKAMLALKNSQQSERDETFQRQQSLIAEAKRKLMAQREAQTAPSVPVAEAVPSADVPEHKVGESVWSSQEPTVVASADSTIAPESNATPQKTAPRTAVQVDEHVIEGVYTADDTAEADTIH